MKLTQKQLVKAWDDRTTKSSPVVWFKEGKGLDSDFMAIGVAGQDGQTYEHSLTSTEWREVTTAPVPAQQSKS